MALYAVTKARFDDQGEVALVKWGKANNEREKPPFIEDQDVVEVDRVVEAFDRGDKVEMWFQVGGEWVSGGALVRKVLPDGKEKVQEERSDGEGRTLLDLPTF